MLNHGRPANITVSPSDVLFHQYRSERRKTETLGDRTSMVTGGIQRRGHKRSVLGLIHQPQSPLTNHGNGIAL